MGEHRLLDRVHLTPSLAHIKLMHEIFARPARDHMKVNVTIRPVFGRDALINSLANRVQVFPMGHYEVRPVIVCAQEKRETFLARASRRYVYEARHYSTPWTRAHISSLSYK
jgi:hypothetical protein